ncbi:unannotated protein [freshwater metagenome]|uniref:Unannotated protein n=1 Tax=freshwater metagenome TaxID=449393 RepID=A0A6J6GAV2_9ZZZZ
MRAVMLPGSSGLSRRSFSSGNRAVRSSKRGRSLALSGEPPLTVLISSRAGFFSLRPAVRAIPVTWSPLRNPY